MQIWPRFSSVCTASCSSHVTSASMRAKNSRGTRHRVAQLALECLCTGLWSVQDKSWGSQSLAVGLVYLGAAGTQADFLSLPVQIQFRSISAEGGLRSQGRDITCPTPSTPLCSVLATLGSQCLDPPKAALPPPLSEPTQALLQRVSSPTAIPILVPHWPCLASASWTQRPLTSFEGPKPAKDIL